MLSRCLAALAVLAVLVLVCTGAGCGGGSQKPKPTATPPAAKLPTLKRAWTVPALHEWENPTTSPLPVSWTVGDLLIVPTRTAVVGLDQATGAQRWKRRVGKVCAIAPRPNADGVVAVLAGKTGGVGAGCAAAITLDGATGRRTHRIDLTDTKAGKRGYGFTDVVVGTKALVVSNGCDAAATYALASGRRTRVLFPGGVEGQCINAFASDGTTIVQGAAEVDPEHFTAYDGVTGRKRFDVAIKRRDRLVDPNPTVERVISTDPLIVDATVDSDRYLRLVDPDLRTQKAIGRGTDDSMPPVLTEVVGDRLVVQYGRGRALFVLDARTGEQQRRIAFDDGEEAVGLRDGKVISVASPTSPSFRDVALVVRSTDPVTGERAVLGGAPADGTEAFLGIRSFLAGSTLVVPAGRQYAGYRLPARGVPEDRFADPGRWGPDDVRPEVADDLCTGITRATQRRLGFLDPGLPAPAGCDWAATTASDGFLQMQVSAFAVEPGRGATAAQAAHKTAAKYAAGDSALDRPAMKPRTGLGDEAWSARKGSRSEPVIEYAARKDNVVIIVSVRSHRGYRGPPPTGLQAATRAAVGDVLAELARRR